MNTRDDESDEAQDGAEVDAALNAVGIDAEDLFALDDEGEELSDASAPPKDRPRHRSRPRHAARRRHDGGGAR